MEDLMMEKLMFFVKKYDNDMDTEMLIRKAYGYAKYLHSGQMRQSGEPYIIHPLNVALILAEMHADRDTICAALLHDVLEDCSDKISREDIVREFHLDVAELVDGVTKISKMNFSSKKDQNLANTRKIILSLHKDVRIILIKLADRLHNMRTLGYKSVFKQKENSIETMEIFVPLAYYLGAYRIKNELEDLSMQYLYPDIYKNLEERIMETYEKRQNCIKEMESKMHQILMDKEIPYEIKVRVKNVYGVYKRLKSVTKLWDIHDFISFKIMVEEIDDCYLLLRPIHQLYRPVPRKMKDLIYSPKTNLYQSLHTTVFAPDGGLVQMQLRTFEMDKIASFGLTAYWDIHKGDARIVMQDELRNKFQFYQSLSEIDRVFEDNQSFVEHVKQELFSDMIHVLSSKGEVVELPKGSTVVDFAFQNHSDMVNQMSYALVNDKIVSLGYVLKNQDRIKIVTKQEECGPKLEWENLAYTTFAKRKIREFCAR